MSTELKNIKEVFRDYNSNSFELNAAKIKSLNLYKKIGKLELNLLSDKLIKINDIKEFEMYIKKRFILEEVETIIEYTQQVEVDIKKEWDDILSYITLKHPFSRVILKGSSVEIKENNINIKLHMKGKEFLISKGFDKLLEKTIQDIYSKRYKVNYIEDNVQDTLEKIKADTENIKHQAILNAIQENKETTEQRKEDEKIENKDEPAQNTETTAKKEEPEEKTPVILGRSANIKEELVKVKDISIDSGKIALDGEIINMDSRELKSGKVLVMFDLYDGSSTITCKSFVEGEKAKQVIGRLKSAKGVKISGTAQFDPFSKELGVIANIIVETAGMKKIERKDNSTIKRVELHMHTQMSQMDGMTSAKDLIKRAMKWGMKSIAITDHGVVQAFPEAHKLLGYDNPDMKVIYGVEAYLVPDETSAISFSRNQSLDDTYCVLDLETTGFSFRTEKITEVGIMKVKNGEVIDEFSCFVNPEKPIPQQVVEVTNITDEMVKDAETIDKVMPKVLEFVGDSVLVAHNAESPTNSNTFSLS